MTILVTGGAGFIGSHLVEQLAQNNEEIIVFDDFSIGQHNLTFLNNLKNVKIIKGSITDRELVNEVVAQCSNIYHLAAMNRAPRSIETPIKSHEINVTGTLYILEAARKCDVENIVFASSSSVYGRSNVFPRKESNETRPAHPYALGKLASEYYCDIYHYLYGLKTKILRYFAVYGPRQSSKVKYAAVIPKFIRNTIERKTLLVYGDGSQTRNFTFVKDNVMATIAAMNSTKTTGKILNVASETEISLNQVINILEDFVENPLRVEFIDWRKGDVKRAPADMELTKNILGVTPQTSIEDGIKETYKWTLLNLNYFQ